MIIGTAGHIDHGKTALIKALTGIDGDRLKEEKARGITIDLGFAYLPIAGGKTLGFVDVPGHERFVHTMLAGASGIDLVLLVVAADDGIKPQTLEHLAIVGLLGIRRGLIALTKSDLVARCYERGFDLFERFAQTAVATGRTGMERTRIGVHLNVQGQAGPLSPLMPQPGLEALPEATRLAQALRGLRRPVIGRIADGGLILDLRCLEDEDAFMAVLTELDVDALARSDHGQS